MPRVSTVILACSLVLSLGAAWLLWRAAEAPPAAGSAQDVVIGGPFTLTDQDGHRRSDTDFRGRWMLVYFGYTYCPDVCPTTLAMISRALAKLGSKAGAVAPVFITVDPERDTPAVLKTYLAAFGPGFVGLTGTPGEIAKVAKAWRVYYARHPLPGGPYAVDHSSAIYLIDPQGRFVKVYDPGVSPDSLAADLRSQL
jgi:protein SCO1/2